MTEKSQITVSAIVCIAFLDAIALSKGIDGVLFMTSLTAISGLAGYHLKNWMGK